MWGDLIQYARDKIVATNAVESFGKDHKSTLLYIETRCVDHGGLVDKRHLRCNPTRHPQFAHDGGWSDEHSTRWAKGVEPIMGHDDWDCIDNMVDAGLIEWNGTGVHPRFALTEFGWQAAHLLRRQRAEQR